MVAPAATTLSALALRRPASNFLSFTSMDTEPDSAATWSSRLSDRAPTYRVELAALELPVRRVELKLSPSLVRTKVATMSSSSSVDRAAIELVTFEGGLDLPGPDRVGLGLLGGRRQRRQASGTPAKEPWQPCRNEAGTRI